MSRRAAWPIVACAAMVVVAAPSGAQTLVTSRTYDADNPYFIEFSVGGVTRGPNGTDFGAGQNYAVDFGVQTRPHVDLALGLGWIHARQTRDAIDSDITYGALRPRAWVERGRWLGYADAGLALYRFSVQQQSVLSAVSDDKLRVGTLAGIGVQHARSKFWVGVGAHVLAAFGQSDLSDKSVLTFTTFDLTLSAPFGR